MTDREKAERTRILALIRKHEADHERIRALLRDLQGVEMSRSVTAGGGSKSHG